MSVILFFFLKDGDRIWNFFLRPFTGEVLERVRRVGDTVPRVLGAYVRVLRSSPSSTPSPSPSAQGWAVRQVPLALPLAVIVFLGAFISLIRATVAGVLAVLVALVANGPIVAFIVLNIVIAVNQLEGDLLQPVVMAQSLTLVILVALTVGTILGGITGAVLSVPITAVAWAIVNVWNKPDESNTVQKPRPRKVGPSPQRAVCGRLSRSGSDLLAQEIA